MNDLSTVQHFYSTKSIIFYSQSEDRTLTEDTADTTVEEVVTPKLRKKIPRTPKRQNVDLDESIQTTVKLRRSKSLNTTKSDALTNDGVEESGVSRPRRINSRLNETTSLEESKTAVSMPSRRTKHSKVRFLYDKIDRKIEFDHKKCINILLLSFQKVQETVESMDQETDENVDDRIKVSRTPSLKRRNSKVFNLQTIRFNIKQ